MLKQETTDVDEWVSRETSLGRARFIAQGSDANDVDDALARMRTVDDWIREWSASAAGHEELAQKAEREGHTLSAGEAYLRASLSYHWGK